MPLTVATVTMPAIHMIALVVIFLIAPGLLLLVGTVVYLIRARPQPPKSSSDE